MLSSVTSVRSLLKTLASKYDAPDVSLIKKEG